MNDDQTDEALMLAYGSGDAGTFEILYQRFRGPLYRYFLRQCSSAVAEELFQDVWLKLIRARESYAVRAKFSTYLFHLAHNRLIDHYRRQSSGVPVSFDADGGPELDQLSAADCEQPERQAQGRQQMGKLLALIKALPAAQREALLMREEAGMNVEQIAEATGVNPETAKSRIRYAVSKLRQGMRQDGESS